MKLITLNVPDCSLCIATRSPRWNSTIRFRRCHPWHSLNQLRSTRTVISLSGTKISITRIGEPRSFARACRTTSLTHDRSPSHLLWLRRGSSSLRPPTLAAASRSGWPSTWNCRGCFARRGPSSSSWWVGASAPRNELEERDEDRRREKERKRERRRGETAFSRCALGRREHRVLSRWTSGNLALMIPRW